MAPEQNWRAYVAIEERSAVREKIRQAYRRNCPTYDQLLETVCGIDEELIYAGSVTRIDYFKSSIDWDNRILIKNKQLRGLVGIGLQANGSHHGSNHSPEREERLVDARKRKAELESNSNQHCFVLVMRTWGGTVRAPSQADGYCAAK